MRTFPQSLRIEPRVGIRGRIPLANHGVQLGDIVVSPPEGTGGVVRPNDAGRVVETKAL